MIAIILVTKSHLSHAFCCDSKGLFARFQGACSDDVTVVAGSSSTTLLPRFSRTRAPFEGIGPLKGEGQTQDFDGKEGGVSEERHKVIVRKVLYLMRAAQVLWYLTADPHQ